MMNVDKELHQLSVNDFCEYILERCGMMCYAKLQKMAFYCDVYHLAYFEQMLLHDPFQAWEHGPVSINNMHQFGGEKILFSDVSFNPINDAAYRHSIEKLTQKQIEFINEVLSVLIDWSDSQLESAIHKEQPYVTARKTNHLIINKAESMNFYKQELT